MSDVYHCSLCNAYHSKGVRLTARHRREEKMVAENADLRAQLAEAQEASIYNDAVLETAMNETDEARRYARKYYLRWEKALAERKKAYDVWVKESWEVDAELTTAQDTNERLEAIIEGDVSVLELKDGKLTTEHPMFRVIANFLHEVFISSGGENYVEVEVRATDRDSGKAKWYVLTIQNRDGLTPHQKGEVLDAELKEAQTRIGALGQVVMAIADLLSKDVNVRDGASIRLSNLDDPIAIPALEHAKAVEPNDVMVNNFELVIKQLKQTALQRKR